MPIKVDWTDKPVYTLLEGLELINYPAWLYRFARDILSDLDDAETAFCSLPFMAEQEVRSRVEQRVYSESDYGNPEFQNMARKAWEAHLLIEKALKEHTNPVVMCSFGKDSMAVLHMVLQHKPDISVLWNDTRVEHPATYKLADRITKEWKLNLIVTRPKVSFWEIKEQHGWPMKGRGVGDKASEVCCKLLKKEPTKRAVKQFRWDLSFLGLNANEGRHRKFSAEKYGDYFYAKTWGMWRCYPILNWSEVEIWDYIVYNQVPVNEVYRPLPSIPGKTKDELEEEYRVYPGEERFHWEDMSVINQFVRGYKARTGCWSCPIGSKFGKLGYLRRFYPRLYNILVVKQGLGVDLLKNKHENSLFPPTIDEVKDTLAMRPCAFDYV